ncbi:MAG: hypothetical protein ACU85V_13200, partial [Gammaproteobacteria bacterium]
ACLAALLLAVPAAAPAATLTEWGTVTSVITADCQGACDDLGIVQGQSGTGGLVNTTDLDADGGDGQLMASSSLATAQGSAQASATIGGGLSLPHLGVAAAAAADGFAGAVAGGFQGYEYTGTGASFDFTVTVSGSVTNDNGGLHTGLGAFGFLFTVPDLEAFGFPDVPSSAIDGFALGTEFLALANIDSIPGDPADALPPNVNPFEVTTTNPDVSGVLTDTMSVTVGDGSVTPQQFYLAVFLYGFADGAGQEVSSLNSLEVTLASPDAGALADLAAVGTPVPLPGAAVLLGLPLATTLGRRRRA